MENAGTVTLMDAQRIERSLKRIAHQIMEDNRAVKKPVIIGINERGYAVAVLLKQYLSKLSGNEVECYQLHVGQNGGIEESLSLSKKYVLLVDDVIFSGTTMFNALKMISENCSPDEVHTVTLIDRGHRQFPVFAQFVGIDLPTKLDEHVSVELKQNIPSRVLLEKSIH